MYIKLLISIILGYVRISVEGYYIERFLNICSNKKIFIWNLKRNNSSKLYLNVGIKNFKKITKIAKKTNCVTRIIGKKGMPFFLHRYKKRKFFCFFLLIIFITIILSSNFVWSINIKINDGEQIDNIEQDLKSLGLKTGMRKDKIDADYIVNNIRLLRNDIAWIGIDVEGTNVIVKIVKAKEQPEIVDNNQYCDIVAKQSGVITKIIAQNGTAQVKVGDNVKKGDILIKGIMEGKYTEPRKVHSLGVVEAEMVYSKTKEISLENCTLEETIKQGSEELAAVLDKELEERGKVTDKQIKTTQNGNSVVVTLIYKIEEEIGEKKSIQ